MNQLYVFDKNLTLELNFLSKSQIRSICEDNPNIKQENEVVWARSCDVREVEGVHGWIVNGGINDCDESIPEIDVNISTVVQPY